MKHTHESLCSTALMIGLCILGFVVGFAIQPPQSITDQSSNMIQGMTPEEQEAVDAKGTLIQFLLSLHEGRYADADKLYRGSYDLLLSWNAVDPKDHVQLWKNGCEMNGLNCLEIRNLDIADHPNAETYMINVWFSNNDGSEFSIPALNADPNIPPQNMFLFMVTKTKTGFKVETMPPYSA